MKALKFIGILLVVIVALLLIIALFLPKEVTVTETTMIKAPAEKIFMQVNDYHSWPNWSPWQKDDTTMVYTYEGAASGTGAISSWKSDKQGDGSQEITESIPFSLIKTKLDFGKKGSATTEWTFEEFEDETSVSWSLTASDLAYPHERIFSQLMKGRLKKDFVTGLENLNKFIESLPDLPKEVAITYETESGVFNLVEKQIEPQAALVVKEMLTMDQVSEKIEAGYQKLGDYCKEAGIEMAGAPFTMWPNFNMEGPTEMIAGFPIKGTADGKNDVEAFTIPGGNVVMAIYMGSYDKVGPTYYAIEKYISEKGKETNGAAWEVYITDPLSEPDTSKWTTHIYYPVK